MYASCFDLSSSIPLSGYAFDEFQYMNQRSVSGSWKNCGSQGPGCTESGFASTFASRSRAIGSQGRSRL
ncbi:hypothetical protein D3C83_230500 [compost metagenome]